MNVKRIACVGLLVIFLCVVTTGPSSCATHFSINKGCGSTYFPGEMVIFSYRVDGSAGDDIKVTLKVELPDSSVNTLFSNKSISPNIQYYATGVVGSQLGVRTATLEWSIISGSPPIGAAGIEVCTYNVGSGGGGGVGTTLRIDSNVSGFQVWWNGVYNHTTPYNYAILYNVPSGSHVVTLKKSGCSDASKTVNIIPNVANQVTINMSCGPGGGEEETADIDGDGVPDDEDRCYNPDCNVVDSRGCPKDSDRDGVNECDDDCPTEAGLPGNDGCPAGDRDNDGVTDDEDGCYNPECDIVDSQGCPRDSDGDGLDDCKDDCPQEYGERSNNGCAAQDSDNDGVTDDVDSCHNPGCNLVDSRGCPWDSDNDGLNDCEDSCPNQSGPRSNNGCAEQQTGPSFCLGTGLLALFVGLGIIFARTTS